MTLLDRGPVFVVGAQRSGTTWVQRLLAAHPSIVAGQESHLFSGYLASLWHRWEVEREASAVGRTVGLACYLTEDEFVEELRRLAHRVLGTLERVKPQATLLVEKTPDHGLHLPLIARVFPGAIVVHVLRDGRDVAASLRAASRRPWGERWAPASVEEAARRWVGWVRTIERDLGRFPRTRTVRYEELSADSGAVLGQLFEFLGVPLPAPTVKAICERWEFRASLAGGEDSLMLQGAARGQVSPEPDGFFRSGRPGGWRSDLSLQEQVAVHAIAGELLGELGYS
jgi:LPS sulfotransferase NodH